VFRSIAKRVVPEAWRPGVRRLVYEPGFYFWRYTAGRGARLERPIFLIGSPRSGTGISSDLFGAHPDVANLSDAHMIWDPRRRFDADADHDWTSNDVTAEDAARLHARFEYHRRFHAKQRFLNKNPRSSVRIDYIRAIFPDAVFVHLIRDGRAVVASMLELVRRRPHLKHLWDAPMRFAHPPNWRTLVREDKAEQSALQWRAIVNTVLSKRAELGSAYHEFKYEELCDDPRGVLAAAWRFAGLRVDAEALEQLPKRLENQNYKWKQQLSLQQVETITRTEAPLLKELGYPL